jgi:alkylhydroperoxidase family enzyme
MRLGILDHGHSLRTRTLLAMIRVFSRHRVVDAVKVALYRPDFYRGGAVTQEAMRGPSSWSLADRELMAAYVSKVNQTEFCILAHSATSSIAYGDGAKVSATLADLQTAPIEEPLRATLQVLGKLTRENKLEVDDIRAALGAGVALDQLKDALAVCFAFNIADRLAEAFDYAVDDTDAITAGARYLVSRGYR